MMEMLGCNSLSRCNAVRASSTLTGLREARDIDAMAGSYSITLLHGHSAEADSLGITTREIMRDCQALIENRILRIVRTHADGLLQMTQSPGPIDPPTRAHTRESRVQRQNSD